MNWGSPERIKDEVTARPPEGWGTFRVDNVRSRTFKKDGVEYEKLVFDLTHENGASIPWWIGQDKSFPLLAKLCEYAGVTWDDGAEGSSIATLLENAFPSIDAKIGYGKGDGAFVNDVALAGAGGSPEEAISNHQAETPSTAKGVAPAPRRKAAF